MLKAAFFCILVTFLLTGQAFAQDATQVSVSTDRQSYGTGDTITISGRISPAPQTSTAVLQVFNTFNVLMQIGIVNISSDGSFTTHIKAEGANWQNDGTYTIKVLYSSPPINAVGTKAITFKAGAAETGTQSSQQSAPQTTPQQSASQQSTQQQTVPQTMPPQQTVPQQTVPQQSTQQTVQVPQGIQVPFWAKDTARRWHDGLAGNAEFGKVIQFMIASGLVKTSEQVTSQDTFDNTPSWVKDPAGWWAQGLVSDTDFAETIQFLITSDIIKP